MTLLSELATFMRLVWSLDRFIMRYLGLNCVMSLMRVAEKVVSVHKSEAHFIKQA